MRSSVVQTTDIALQAPLPPLAPGAGLLGNALDLYSDPVHFFASMYQQYGPIFRVRVPWREWTVLAGQEANLFLIKHDGTLLTSTKAYKRAAKELRTNHFVSALDGAEHEVQRDILKPAFTGSAISEYIPRMLEVADQMTRTWKPGQRVQKDALQRLVSAQLAFAMTGHLLGEEYRYSARFSEYLNGAAIAGTRPPILLLHPSYLAAKRKVRRLMHQILEQRSAQGVNERRKQKLHLVDVMLEARDEHGQALSEDEMFVGLQLPFLAGMDTIAGLVGCALYELARHPTVKEQVQREVDEAFCQGIPDAKTFRRMRTLHNVILETFRLYAIVTGVPRTAKVGFEFQGKRVDPGQRLLIATTASHFSPRFFPDPMKFDIARFSPPRNEHLQHGALGPFSLGTHTCLGAGVSETGLEATVATILHNVRYAFDPNSVLQIKLVPLPGPANFSMRVLEQRAPSAASGKDE